MRTYAREIFLILLCLATTMACGEASSDETSVPAVAEEALISQHSDGVAFTMSNAAAGKPFWRFITCRLAHCWPLANIQRASSRNNMTCCARVPGTSPLFMISGLAKK